MVHAITVPVLSLEVSGANWASCSQNGPVNRAVHFIDIEHAYSAHRRNTRITTVGHIIKVADSA